MPEESGSRARMPTLRRFAFGEEQVRRALAEHIEDDLHRLHARILDRFQRLFHFLDAHAVIADLPGFHQVVQQAEHLRR